MNGHIAPRPQTASSRQTSIAIATLLLLVALVVQVFALASSASAAEAEAEATLTDDTDASTCAATEKPTYFLQDDMENPASDNWVQTQDEGTGSWANQAGLGAGGTRALVGSEPTGRGDHSAATRLASALPPGPAKSYLRFSNMRQFEHYENGGAPEYSADGGAWTNAMSLLTDVSFPDEIPSWADSPLAGQPAFTFAYDEWETRRLDLSGLAGQSVRIRFRVGTSVESPGGDGGWRIDDVALYTCEPIAVPGAPTGVSATGGLRLANVSWTAPAAPGGGPISAWDVTALANGTTPGTPRRISGGATRSATIGGLTNGTPYTFQVAAVNQGGVGPVSAPSNSIVPAVPAIGGSIVFTRGNNLWLSAPDGSGARQLTTDGTAEVPYESASQSDDGSVVVAVRNYTDLGHGEGRIFVLNRQGQLLNSFVPPDQWQPVPGDCFRKISPTGIETVRVSPDGTRLVYEPHAIGAYRDFSGYCRFTDLGMTFVSNLDNSNRVQLRRATGETDFKYPSWVSNSRVVVRYGLSEAGVYTYDLGATAAVQWFTNSASDDYHSSVNPIQRGAKLADTTLGQTLRVWATNGGPPAAPTRRCMIGAPAGSGDTVAGFHRPTWSPDGSYLAWVETGGTADAADEGIYLSAVGDLADPTTCPAHETAVLVVQGGTDPHWGPAAVGDPVVTPTSAAVDFDGDGDTDRSVFRAGAWYAQGQGTGFLGTAGDIPVPADYDGDGDSDRAVYRNGAWFVDGQATVFLGVASDIPVPADYDGDGDADRAVFRPSVGGWFVDGQATVFFGLSTDIAVPADYDGDGDADRAVYRPSVGGWYVNGQATVFLGLSGDVPVPGDYDGNGTADRGIFRRAVGGWYVQGQATVFLGLNGDVPVPGDYDGNGAVDRGIFRPAVGGWYVQGQAPVFLGLHGDVPLPLPQAVYRTFF